MQSILVTGSAGFIGRHLMEALGRRKDVRVIGYDIGNTQRELDTALAEADFIFHLAGVNRPQRPEEFKTGNADFTASICDSLTALGRKPTFVLSSSIQAELDNPYGLSKRQAEEVLQKWAEGEGKGPRDHGPLTTGPGSGEEAEGTQQRSEVGDQRSEGGARAIIFRLKNVFGKWCRPNYNSVVATFCHNIAHDLPISISDPNKELELVYIDDVVAAFTAVLDEHPADLRPLPSDLRPPPSDPCSVPPGPVVSGQWSRGPVAYGDIPRSFKTTLGVLADTIRSFRQSRQSLRLPSFADDFTRCLYATYLSHLEGPNFAYRLDLKTDNRGCLAEFMKSEHFGQIFVSRTKPGITRGNHYHHTKTEKFLVLEGEAVIRFRAIQTSEVGGRGGGQRAEGGGQRTEDGEQRSEMIEYRISGTDFRVVDIPPGYTHSIENVGNTEMVVLFWASEIYDPARPDTYAMAVQ